MASSASHELVSGSGGCCDCRCVKFLGHVTNHQYMHCTQGERFVVKAMAAAAANSTLAYMDSLGAGNSYEDVFAAAFAPRHRDALKELTVIATREAVAAYLCPPHRCCVQRLSTSL